MYGLSGTAVRCGSGVSARLLGGWLEGDSRPPCFSPVFFRSLTSGFPSLALVGVLFPDFLPLRLLPAWTSLGLLSGLFGLSTDLFEVADVMASISWQVGTRPNGYHAQNSSSRACAKICVKSGNDLPDPMPRRMRRLLHRAVDFLDNDGIDLDRRIRIEVAATIKEGTIHFDLTGSSPQVKGPINCVPSGSLAAACFAVRAITDPAIPNNGGCFRPITLTLPEGSIVNPREPAPVNARTATIKRVTNTMLKALAGVAPDRVPAPNSGELLVMAWGGQRRDGRMFVTGELLAGGAGAGNGFDGVDAIETDATNCMNLPVEAMELDAPIRVRRWELVTNSGGEGQFRGGRGQLKEYEVLDDVAGTMSYSHRGERHFVAADGLAGGKPGGLARSWITRADGHEEVIPSKTVTRLAPGDRVVITTAGGGGYGPPEARDPDAARRDIADGKVEG